MIEVFGIEAFLPGSQIDVKPIRDYDEYVGRDMEFKVVKVNDVYRNIVVSPRVVLIDYFRRSKKNHVKIRKRSSNRRIVKNITSYGSFRQKISVVSMD